MFSTAFDPVSGSLWCAVCKDVVHHADLDRIKVRELVATEDKVLGKRKSKGETTSSLSYSILVVFCEVSRVLGVSRRQRKTIEEV